MLSTIKTNNLTSLIMRLLFAWLLVLPNSWAQSDAHTTSATEPPITLPSNITYATFANLTTVGQTTLKWLWFKVYDAKLMTPSGKYQNKQWPLALALIYKRDITSEDLVKSTKEQWQRLEMPYQPAWLNTIQAIWPDVKKGDEIMLGVDKDSNAWFFYNGKYIGGIKADKNISVQFAYAFSQIWLSEKALVPKSRNELIGATNE